MNYLFNKPMDKIKALDNIPLTLEFKYSEPKMWENEGQWGKFKTYSYGVVYKGVDAYFSATETLYNLLFKLGDLRGRTLTLTILQNPNDLKKKYWRIQDERENDITPSFNSQTSVGTTSPQKPQEGAKMNATEGLDIPKLKEWAKKTDSRQNSTEARLRAIEEKLFPETGELSRDGVHMAVEDAEKIAY